MPRAKGPRGRGTSDDELVYPMDHPRRGVAAIFNQEVFDDPKISPRTYTEIDVDSLHRTFARLGFDVELYKNLDMADMMDSLDNLRARDHSDCDCFVLTYMTHGKEGQIHCRDTQFDVNVLWDKFTAEACPSLANKPKIFIIQACQGPNRQQGVNVYAGKGMMEDQERVVLVPSYQLPKGGDFLLALSTIPGFTSVRYPTLGAVYIQALCCQLDSQGTDHDMLTLLTRVNRDIAIDHSSRPDPVTNAVRKQQPSVISLLLRKLKFTKKKKGCRVPQPESSSNENKDSRRSRSPFGRPGDKGRRRRKSTSREIFSVKPPKKFRRINE